MHDCSEYLKFVKKLNAYKLMNKLKGTVMHLREYYSGKKRKLQSVITCELWSHCMKLNKLIIEVPSSIPLTRGACLITCGAMYSLDVICVHLI